MSDACLSQQSESHNECRSAPAGFRLTANERLFFECLIEALGSHGVLPPPNVPAPAFARVVDYNHVKRAMRRRLIGELKDGDPDHIKKMRRVQHALKRARVTLMGFKVIWAHSGYVWWTGKPVRDFSPT